MWGKIGGSIIALIGFGLLCYSFTWIGQEALLAATGRSTTGAVTEKTSSSDENQHLSYYISYRYKDDSGNDYASKSDVSTAMYEMSMEGGPITVVYSSTYPSVSEIRPTGSGLLPGGILALMGGGALWWGFRMLLRRIRWDNKMARLITNGERRIGRLVAVEEDTSEQAEDYIPLVLVYAFTDKSGQEHTGKTFHVKPLDHEFWKGRIGCSLDVRVNPADPEDHVALVEESKLLK
jgi:hypothetical protein